MVRAHLERRQPTAEQIDQRRRAIQAGWSPEERCRRARQAMAQINSLRAMFASSTEMIRPTGDRTLARWGTRPADRRR